MNEESIKVSISGKSVYKAVANYLKNNETLQAQITESVKNILADSHFVAGIQTQVLKSVWDLLNTTEIKQSIRMTVKNGIENMVKDKVHLELEKRLSEMDKDDLIPLVIKKPKP